MDAVRRQRTISRPAVVEGFGYWSGRDVRVEFRPAPADSGVVFVRTDQKPAQTIAAVIENRVEVPRRTVLRDGHASVEMIEHLMAALAGLGVHNCEIRLDQAELPGCDGSSQAFVEALDAAGVVEQDAQRPRLIVRETARVGDDDCWIEARPAPHGEMSLKYHLDYGSANGIGRQTLCMTVTPESFRRELADCRTFLLKEEADWLRRQGIGNRATTADLLVFDEHGPIDNELRHPDECARHKALDLIGDLSLTGCDLVGHFIAHRSGHRQNAQMVRSLLTEGEIVTTRRCSA